MSLVFAGFPVATFDEMGTAARVLATIRAECDPKGRCHKDQRWLAGKARLPLGTFGYHVAKFKRRGVISVIRGSRRKKAVIIIRPEHRWVTAEKPAPKPAECSTFSNTSSKARGKDFILSDEPSAAPAQGSPPPVENLIEEGVSALGDASKAPLIGKLRRTWGDGIVRNAIRRLEAERGKVRHPVGYLIACCKPPSGPALRPRRRTSLAQTVLDIGMATAQPASGPALPPPPDIIPPGHEFVAGEVTPIPRQAAPRPRGFSPTTDNWEAFKHVAGMSGNPDCTSGDDFARALLAAGRARRDAANDRRRVA